MWFAGENDEWLSEAAHVQRVQPHAAGERLGQANEDLPIEIPSGSPVDNVDLRNLPEAPPCSLRKYIQSYALILFLDVTENVVYFSSKIHSKKVFVSLTHDEELLVPGHVIHDLKVAYATSAAVIVVLFDYSTQSFEGYALIRSLPSFVDCNSSGMIPIAATLIRRASVKFSQVMHIKDDQGLRGRSLSAVRDGSKLGISAGRVLCRYIDKKAYSEDPVHYRDPQNFIPSIITGVQPHVRVPSRAETDLLNMDFSRYLEEYARRRSSTELVPSLDSLVYR